jgi:hypothetical protein
MVHVLMSWWFRPLFGHYYNSCVRIWKMVYADTQPKWLPPKEVLMLSYYVFEIDYGYCGNYSVAIWAARSIYCLYRHCVVPLHFNGLFFVECSRINLIIPDFYTMLQRYQYTRAHLKPDLINCRIGMRKGLFSRCRY